MNQPNQAVVMASTLYIVPTPIGNMGDITQRALDVLKHVDLIAAEDTRHSGILLQNFAINARLFALHDHNEQQKADQLISRLQQGDSIALVSDAGTPLINDPGYHLVNRCREAVFVSYLYRVPVLLLPRYQQRVYPQTVFVMKVFYLLKQKGVKMFYNHSNKKLAR